MSRYENFVSVEIDDSMDSFCKFLYQECQLSISV